MKSTLGGEILRMMLDTQPGNGPRDQDRKGELIRGEIWVDKTTIHNAEANLAFKMFRFSRQEREKWRFWSHSWSPVMYNSGPATFDDIEDLGRSGRKY
jgi:hypothetical protein